MCGRRPWHKWTLWERAELVWDSSLLQALTKGRVGKPEVVSGRMRECSRCLKVELRNDGF